MRAIVYALLFIGFAILGSTFMVMCMFMQSVWDSVPTVLSACAIVYMLGAGVCLAACVIALLKDWRMWNDTMRKAVARIRLARVTT